MASSRRIRVGSSSSRTNRHGVVWCGAGAVMAAATARRTTPRSTGSSVNSRTVRRASTAVAHRLAGSASKPVVFGRSDEGGGAGSVGRGHQMGEPADHRRRNAGELAPDQLGRSGKLVGNRDDGDRQRVAIGVGVPAQVVADDDAGSANREVDDAVAPRPACGVGDDDPHLDAEVLEQPAADRGRRTGRDASGAMRLRPDPRWTRRRRRQPARSRAGSGRRRCVRGESSTGRLPARSRRRSRPPGRHQRTCDPPPCSQPCC